MLWWIVQLEMKKKETNDVRNNLIKLVNAMKQIQTYDKLVLFVNDIVASVHSCFLPSLNSIEKENKSKKEVVC